MKTTVTIRRLALIGLIAGALCAPAMTASAQAPPPPPPGIGVKLLQGPAEALDNPRAHDYIIDHLAPGTTISRQIGFTNGEPESIDLSFYAEAAIVRGGAFAPGAGHTANDLTGWTTFSPTSATVAPGEMVVVTVTISVPIDATSGERYAAALAELVTPPAPGGGVTSVSRVGIRIYLSVGTGGAPATAFVIDSMTAGRDADGNPSVAAQVHNTGGRAVDLSGHLGLSNGPSSLSAGPFQVQTVPTLAPGESGAVTIPLDRALPDGPWDAQITLTSGLNTESGTARLTFPTASAASAAPVAVKGSASRTRDIAIAAGFLLVLAGLGLAAHRSRTRRSPAARAASTYEASQHNVPTTFAPQSWSPGA